MDQAIIGVFESEREAAQARELLSSAGLDPTNLPGATRQGDGQEGGIGGFFRRLFGSDEHPHVDRYSEALANGHTVLMVHAMSDEDADRAHEIMESCGAIDVEDQTSQGYAQPVAESRARSTLDGAERQTIPVIEEELQVGKRQVQRGGARIYTRVTEKPVEQTVDLKEEHVIIERRPVDRPATDVDFRDGQERELEIRTTAEEPVIAKTARVVEEVEIGRQTTHRKETVRDTVQRRDVEIEGDVDQDAPIPMPQDRRPDKRPM